MRHYSLRFIVSIVSVQMSSFSFSLSPRVSTLSPQLSLRLWRNSSHDMPPGGTRPGSRACSAEYANHQYLRMYSGRLDQYLVSLGPKVTPLVVQKRTRASEFLAVELSNQLEANPAHKDIDPICLRGSTGSRRLPPRRHRRPSTPTSLSGTTSSHTYNCQLAARPGSRAMGTGTPLRHAHFEDRLLKQ